ncbi:hypothetical protein EON64_17015, partial [archaeon]
MLSWQQLDHLYHISPLLEQSHEPAAWLTVTEISSGLVKATVLLEQAFEDLNAIRIVSSPDLLVLFHPATGEHKVYSLSSYSFLGSVRKLLTHGNRVLTACEPRLENGLFVFACEDESLYALLVRKPKGHGASASLSVSPAFRLPEGAKGGDKDKGRGKLLKIHAHP